MPVPPWLHPVGMAAETTLECPHALADGLLSVPASPAAAGQPCAHVSARDPALNGPPSSPSDGTHGIPVRAVGRALPSGAARLASAAGPGQPFISSKTLGGGGLQNDSGSIH